MKGTSRWSSLYLRILLLLCRLLANLMLPDGAERHFEDWTIFFLNQTPFNTISPVLALETPDHSDDRSTAGGNRSELIYVLNLVRTKHDKSVRRYVVSYRVVMQCMSHFTTCFRGAVVKAMAICTRHPFIQIFKVCATVDTLSSALLRPYQPVLLLALDDYFSNPSQDCLARLFDAINSMDVTGAPVLTRYEKLIMRASERKDIFAEKFTACKASDMVVTPINSTQQHKTNSSTSSHSSEDGALTKNRNAPSDTTRERSTTESTTASSQPQHRSSSPSDSSFSLGGSAVWVNDESVMLDSQVGVAIGGGPGSVTSGSGTLASRGRKSTDASSSSSNGLGKDPNALGAAIPTASDSQLRSGISKDTHFFQTSIIYKGHQLPIKLPVATFPEEVGDVSFTCALVFLPLLTRCLFSTH